MQDLEREFFETNPYLASSPQLALIITRPAWYSKDVQWLMIRPQPGFNEAGRPGAGLRRRYSPFLRS